MLEYIQIFADMESLFEPYDDAQRGRLIMAMMAYAYRGEEPNFTGVEKFIWPVLRQHVDRCSQNVEAKKAAGSKGGKRASSDKQSKAEESRNKQSEAETSESKQNAHNHDHDNDHEHDNDHNHEEVCARAREDATTTTAADPVIGIDGQDLSESIRMNAEVDVLLRTYRLSEAVRGDLLEDIDKHGLDKVKRVIHEAAQSDTKGGLSIRFIRACLENDGKPKPARATGKDVMQRHSYTPDQYRAMVTDLDADDDSGKPKGKDGDMMLRANKKDRKATYSAAIVDFDEVD